jgi:hypothetical protein
LRLSSKAPCPHYVRINFAGRPMSRRASPLNIVP